MLSQLYAIPTEEPRETPAETAMLPLARMVRDEWVTTFFRDSHSKDNWTQEDREKREEYLTLMLKEPAVSTAFWSLIASVMSLPLKVHAADPDDPKDVYWANFVRDAIQCVQGGVPKMVANTAAGGLLFGFGLCEMVFDYPERGKWTKNLVLDQYAPLDSRFIKFDLDPFKRVRGVRPTKANGGQVFGPERFAIFSHQSLFGSPFGLSKFRPAYRAAKMMESAIKLRVILLQNFTGPFLVLKSGGATSRETAMRVLSEARALGYMVCDRQDDAQVLNMAAGSDSEFQSAIDDLRKEMYTAIRWGYLPFTEAQSGVQVGNSEVQKSMTQLGEWMLATEIAQVFTEQIAKPLIRFNCPDDSVGFPSISLGGQNSTDKRAAGEIFEQAKRLNVILSKRQVQRALDIEEPADKEDELRDPVQPGPGGGNPFTGQDGFDPLAGMGPDLGGGGVPGGPGGPAPDGGGAPVPAGGPAPTDAGDPKTQPDPHDKVDFSHIDPTIGRVSPVEMDKAALVAALDLRAKAVSLGQPGRFQRAIDALRSMIGNHPAMRAAIMSGGKVTDGVPPPADQKFGWMAESTKSGRTKAVGTGEHAGWILYGQDAQRALYPQQHGAAQPTATTSGSKTAEGTKANPTSGSKSGLTRAYAAGFNKDSGITFANENQRDLFDLGAKIRSGMRTGRPADTSALEQSLSTRLGMDPSEVHAKALDVHADLKKQMAGVKAGETRAVKDNHETQGYQSLGKQISTMGLEQVEATRDKLAPTPAVEAMAEKLTDHVAAQTGEKLKAGPAAELLHEHLANAKGLTDDQRETYGNAIDRVTFNMPDAAHARLAKNLGGGVTFHADTAGIGQAVKRDVLSISREDRHAAIHDRFKGTEGQKFGGGYVLGKGSVHIDGGKDGASPHEVYAHVLGHAIDGPQHEISNSDKWWDAFTSEIAMTPEGKYPLGKHAGRTPEDGFAEFSRLLYASDVPHEQVAAKFPRATAVFRSHGLLPDGFGAEASVGPDVAANRPKPGRSTAAMARYGKDRDETPNTFRLPEIFGGRIDAHPDGSHIDVLAGKPQPGQAEPATEQPNYRDQFQAAHTQGDDPAAHDLIAEALQGKHGDAVQTAVGDALDEHYKAGAPGGEKAKRDAILDAVGKIDPADMGDSFEGDLPERKSTLSAEDDPFAAPKVDDEFPDTKGVTGADLLGKLNAIGDDGKAIRKPKSKDSGGDALHQIVTKSGGIDPTSPDFLKHFEGVNEAVEYGIPRTVFKIGGREPYELAKELHNEGHIHIEGQSDDAPDVDGTDHLFQQLATGAKSLHSQGDRADRAADENARREQDEAEANQPWKLTKGEFLKQHAAYEQHTRQAQNLFADDDAMDLNAAEAKWKFPAAYAARMAPNPGGTYSPEDAHRRSVEAAMKEGRSVPANVLKDYPDLAPAKAAVATTATLKVGPTTPRAKGEAKTGASKSAVSVDDKIAFDIEKTGQGPASGHQFDYHDPKTGSKRKATIVKVEKIPIVATVHGENVDSEHDWYTVKLDQAYGHLPGTSGGSAKTIKASLSQLVERGLTGFGVATPKAEGDEPTSRVKTVRFNPLTGKPEAEAGGEPKAKEPWEMTRAEWDKQTEGPPVPEGHIRLYSGHAEGEPSQWFSPDREEVAEMFAGDAAANTGKAGHISYLDIPKKDSDKYQDAANEANDQQNQANLYAEGAHYLPPELVKQAKFLKHEGPHEIHVENAIAAGKPVPPEVLADYPDLATQSAAKPSESVGEQEADWVSELGDLDTYGRNGKGMRDRARSLLKTLAEGRAYENLNDSQKKAFVNEIHELYDPQVRQEDRESKERKIADRYRKLNESQSPATKPGSPLTGKPESEQSNIEAGEDASSAMVKKLSEVHHPDAQVSVSRDLDEPESEPRVDSIRLNGRKVDGTGVDNGYRYYIRRHHGAETYSFDGGQTWATDKGKAFEGRVVEKEFKVPATRGEDVANPPATPNGTLQSVKTVDIASGPVEGLTPRTMTAEQAADAVREHMANLGKPGFEQDDLFEKLSNMPTAERTAFNRDHGLSGWANDETADFGKLWDKFKPAKNDPGKAIIAPTRQGYVAIPQGAETADPHQKLIDAGRLRKWGDRWQYLSGEPGQAGSKWFYGNDKEGAAEGARLFMKPKGGSLDISGIDENTNNQPPEANKLTVGEGTSNDANQLEATGSGSGQERLSAGQLVGSDAGSSPAIAPTGSGEGTEPERGLPSVSPGSDEQLSRRVFGDGGSGDGPARSPVVSDADVIADPAGRDRPARGVGAGSRDVRPDGSNGAVLEQSELEKSLAKPSTPENPTAAGAANFRYDSSDFFAHGLKAKFAANVAAMRTLQSIKAEGRTHATPEEQQILSRFVGWGQFPALFNHADQKWSKEREVFRDLVGGYGSDEWDAAKRSTLNAHYTHPDVVKAHWRMAQRLGFDGGRYLETSAGIGYYLGMMPPELAGKTKSTAIELEKTTGEMLKHLYPKAVVKVQGFQDHKPPKDFYDLIASNVPFGDYKVHDPDYNRHQANIHDYFFLKSATHLRPGGLMMHITSTGTLDKADPKIRAELAKTCDLVGAIRFPGAAHKENAGTDVVTDMVILRKRLPGEQPGNMDWLETTTVPDPAGGEPILVNKHFANNPHMVLGTLDRTGTMYQGNSVNVSRTDDYEQRLEAAIQGLPEGVFTKASKTVSQEPFAPVVDDPGKNKNGAFVLHEGKLHVKEGDSLIPKTVDPKTAEKITGHIQIRDAVRGVINAQIQGGDADAARKTLNKVYDEFVRKHGPLNSQANRKAFTTDPDSPVLLAIENYDAKTKKAAKADIFAKNTVRSVKKADKAGSPEEALGISLHERGQVDISHIAKLTGKSPEEIGGHLVSKGLAFEDPSHGWKHASEYLSGNVRKKLALARAAAEVDPKFQANVAALEAIQPQDVSHEDIDVKLGASWLPPSDYARFAAELLDGQPEHFKITYNPHNGSWLADFTSRGASALRNRRGNREVYGTARREFMDLLEPALNGQTVTIYDKTSDGTSTVNREETDNANAKIQEIKDKFKDWVWTDDERRERLHRHYNDNFNNTVPMKYDGAHQQFPGMNPHIDLRPHQKDFVWQTVTTGKGLAAHEVGTGKTYTMAAAAMELRRLGLAKKPAIACLKANIDQVAKEAQELYPHARILAVDKFDARNRKKIISQMATGDYDMVILTHDNLNMLQMKPETISRFIKEELDELEAAKLSAESEGGNKKGNRIVKQLEKAKENLEAKLKEALDASKKDDAVFFEETGIDHLFVDEAHKYKSLPVYTKQDRVKGIPTSRSDRATGMLMRTRWLMEQNGGRGVTFATGTPVANTMAELFNMQRYLQPDELKERGVHTFDSWASTFGDIATKMEFSTTGEYKPVSRFARFVNIPELMQTARQIMDVQRATGLKNKEGQSTIKRPNRKQYVVESPHSPQMKAFMNKLRLRAAKLKEDKNGKDNMFVIGTDGKKAAIDMRLVDPFAHDDPQSKVNKAVQNVLQIHKNNPGKTQMIFSDVGVHPMKHGFHLYEDIIQKLEKGGIPRDKIVNFADLDTKAKKEAGIMALKTGKALVGIGGTDRMGTGVNAQDHLLALHHLDIPYQPAEVEQRDGRGWRQGNTNKDVHIYRYVAHGSLDQTFWQIIDNKSRFIKQVLTPGTVAPREAKDEDTEELTPEQLMAAASGDPKILEKVNIGEDVRQLSAAEKRHVGEQIKLRDSVARGERLLPKMHELHQRMKLDAEHVLKAPIKFNLKIDKGSEYSDRDEATKALAEAFEKANDPYNRGVRLGELKGMGIYKRGGQLYVVGPSGEEYVTGFTAGSIEHAIRDIGKQAKKQEEEIERTKSELDKIRGKIGATFPKKAELEAKQARLKDLEDYFRGDFLPEGYSVGQEIQMADGRKVKIVGTIPNKQIKVSDGKSEFHIGHDDLPEIKK